MRVISFNRLHHNSTLTMYDIHCTKDHCLDCAT